MVRVILNGFEVAPKDVSGEPDIRTTITVEDEDGASLVKTVSGELTFYGTAYETIRDLLIIPAGGRLEEVPITLLETCSDPDWIAFEGTVRGDLVNWCEGVCSVRVTCVEKTVTSAAMDCLKSTLIFDNHSGFQQQAHPRMRYCDEIRPEWLHHVIMILAVFAMLVLDILTPVIFIVAAIVTVINIIISAINVIPGVNVDPIDIDGNPNTNTFQEWQAIRGRILETLIGCGRAHPSPLVRSYLNNVCSKCGIAFQSSILNNPSADYWNMVLWAAQVEKGTRDDSVPYIYANRPIMSGEQLLDRLKVVFNARYGVRVIGGVPTLVFERRDQLQGNTVWVDPMALKADGRLIGELCYNYSSENPAAYLVIGFSEDGFDEPGNEAREYYKDIVEWNLPFNAVQKGDKQVQFQFGMLRNRRDGIGGDILDDYTWYPSLAGPINQYGHAMMVSRGIAMFPKLLIWNGNLVEGEVRRGYDPGQDGGALFGKAPDKLYNFPLNVSEFNVPTNTAAAPDAPNVDLYGRFHAIEAPKVSGERGVDFEFEFEFNAADLINMDLFASVPLPIGTGRITSVTINHTQGTILVAGKA